MKGIFAFDVAVVQTETGLRFPAIECNPRFNGASYPTMIVHKLDIPEWSAVTLSTKHRSLSDIGLSDIEFDMKTGVGGIVNKRMGRVGDSPIIGAGLYADNETCAVSATGYGEGFMRSVIAKTIADFIDMKDMKAQEATQAGIDYLTRKVKGRGGVIVIDRDGHCASGFTTRKMIHGWIERGGDAVVRF